MNIYNQSRELLFLETTIQIERVIGTSQRRQTIRHNLEGRRLCTSGYVLAEYNRTLIKDAITFYDILLTSPTVEEAVTRSAKYARSRKFPRMMLLLASLGFDGDKQRTLERLEAFIEWRAHAHFFESMDVSCYCDEIMCDIRQWRPSFQETMYDTSALECLKGGQPTCSVQRFIDSHIDTLKNFISKGSGHEREGVDNAAKAFQKVIVDKQTPFNERFCYKLGDTLIILEASDESNIYSSDGDVVAIAVIVGKNLHREESM